MAELLKIQRDAIKSTIVLTEAMKLIYARIFQVFIFFIFIYIILKVLNSPPKKKLVSCQLFCENRCEDKNICDYNQDCKKKKNDEYNASCKSANCFLFE